MSQSLIFKHAHLHLFLFHFCKLLQTFSFNKQSHLQVLWNEIFLKTFFRDIRSKLFALIFLTLSGKQTLK